MLSDRDVELLIEALEVFADRQRRAIAKKKGDAINKTVTYEAIAIESQTIVAAHELSARLRVMPR